MSNFLVRWLGNALTRSAGEELLSLNIGKSVAVAPWPSIIEVPGAKTVPPESENGPTVIDQLCVCAVHDEPFMTPLHKTAGWQIPFDRKFQAWRRSEI